MRRRPRRARRKALPSRASHLANGKSSACHPLVEVRRGEREVRDVKSVADVLANPEGSLEKRNHWEKSSHSLLVGAVLHVLYAEPYGTLAGVAGCLSRHPSSPG